MTSPGLEGLNGLLITGVPLRQSGLTNEIFGVANSQHA
jgi:hypothetical protein